jgi:two-component system cell cycle response regulator
MRDGDLIKIGRTIFKFLTGGNIENAYHEEIYRLTTIDGLTQIFNKRYFTEQLERELSRSHRYRHELALVMFDIDHFKKINDTHGHLAGDHVLKNLAQAVKNNIRREDILARYGGEEFAIVVRGIEHDKVTVFAERVRRAVEFLDISYEGTRIKATVSVGAASISQVEGEPTPETLLLLADERLYRAKDSGRNRVSA